MISDEGGRSVLPKIHVVCVGNICRSPMAEILFRHYVPRLSVSSSGLGALSGCPMDSTALAVLDEHGLDGRGHIASQLHDNLIFRADLVLGMEMAHVKAMKDQVPQASERIFLLGQQDVPDPFRQPRSAFIEAYRMIDLAVKAWVPRLYAGVNQHSRIQ